MNHNRKIIGFLFMITIGRPLDGMDKEPKRKTPERKQQHLSDNVARAGGYTLEAFFRAANYFREITAFIDNAGLSPAHQSPSQNNAGAKNQGSICQYKTGEK